MQHDGGADDLAQSFVGDAEHRGLGDRIVLIDGCLDLAAVHVLATTQHHVLGAVDDEHESVLVDAGDVAGVEPTVANRVGSRLGTIEVALDHDRRRARTVGPTTSAPGSRSLPSSSTSLASRVGTIGPAESGLARYSRAPLAVTMPCVSVRP